MTDRWRRHRREVPIDEAGEPSAQDPDVASRMDIAKTFGVLRPMERQLMWLAYVEGATHREIAAALGLREGSVRVLLSRARAKMAALLRDQRSTSSGETA